MSMLDGAIEGKHALPVQPGRRNAKLLSTVPNVQMGGVKFGSANELSGSRGTEGGVAKPSYLRDVHGMDVDADQLS
jgi:hypothetical protein